MYHWKTHRTFLILIILALITMGTQCRPVVTNPDDDVLIPVSWETKFHGLNVSFTSPGNLPCTGEYLKWEDVRVFIPTITLKDGPAEGPLTISFDVQGAKEFFGSARLGLLEATWITGDTSASSFRYVTQAPASGTTVPEGATTITNGFWLGCTKKCAVRGNAGKTGTAARDVFLRSRTSQAEIQNDFSPVVGCEQ